MLSTVHLSTIHQLKELIHQDPGNRLFTSIAKQNDLLEASVKLLDSKRIIIITGFCVLDTMTGETDGPPGALVIGSALATMGKHIMFVTDQYSSAILKAGMDEYCPLKNTSIMTIDIHQTKKQILKTLETFDPDHVISIERPGKAADGHSYSMRGEILSHVIPQLDLFFDPQPYAKKTYHTTAIGDGGNEMGLGYYFDEISKAVPMGSLIACTTKADYVIPAGVSNWAGYALAATLSLLTHKPLLPPGEREDAVITAMVASGAVDGCTKKHKKSVDGIDYKEYLTVIRQITHLTQNNITSTKS